MYFRFITETELRSERQIPGSGEPWVPFILLWRSLSIHWEITLSDISTITPPPPSSLLRGSSVFTVPFDPKIPLFTFLSLLGINTHRILTEESLSSPSTRQSQENNLKLMNDPMCGLPAGGGGCELDCDIHPDTNTYSDPTCLRDCPQYPACFHQLYRDFETAGRVGIIKQAISWFVETKLEL